MRSTALIVLILVFIIAGCTGGSTPAQNQPPANNPPQIEGLLPDLTDLTGGATSKAASEAVLLPLETCGFVGNVTVAGAPATVELASGPTEMAAAWWGLTVSYGDPSRPVPYIAPYEMTINTDNGGEFWILLADYSQGNWNVLPETYSGASVTIPVGLEAAASTVGGTFWWALITYGGETVTIESINLEYPDPGFPDDPIEYQMSIPAGDGTLLATEVFLPLTKLNPIIPDPPYPVILLRTPYSKDMIYYTDFWDTVQLMTDANIVFMVQYFRGRLNDSGAYPDSEGTETMFRDHAGPLFNDAIDTIDWIEARNFYNGDLILSGPSALGLWIYQAAPELGDRVRGIYPQMASANVGDWAARRNGCFKRSNVEGWLTGNGYPPELLPEVIANFEDDAYWDAVDFDVRADEVNTPGYHETGWWDVDVESTINTWQEINTNGGPLAVGEQYLVIGPWDHRPLERPGIVGDLEFPTGIGNDPTQLLTQWDGINWVTHMLGRDPFFVYPSYNVYYYMIGNEGSEVHPNNTWIQGADWPPAYTERVFYLIDDPGFGLFHVEPTPGTMTWDCDPALPVASFGGANLPITSLIDAGPYDQALSTIHPHVMTLSTGALMSNIPMAGPINVELFVETDAADTDIMVRICDKYPDGTYMLIADSAVRLSWYLNKYTIWPEVTPGQVYQVNFEVGQRAYNIESGHELVLMLQSTNYPRYDINPGNGDPFYDGTNGVIQHNTVHYGTGNLSRLIIPEYNPPI